MVALIDEGNANVGSLEGLDALKTGEPTTHEDDVRSGIGFVDIGCGYYAIPLICEPALRIHRILRVIFES